MIQSLYFGFPVQAQGKIGEGKGRTKKKAKLRAAYDLIEKLGLLEDEDMAEIIIVPEEIVNFNSIGELADYCYLNNHPEPEYDNINEADLLHEKTFSVRCSVSQLHEIAEASTKEETKQLSAAQMLSCLKSQASEEHNALVPAGTVDTSEKGQGLTDAEAKVIEKYRELRMSFDLLLDREKYIDLEQAFIGIHESSPTLAKIVNNEISVSQSDAINLLESITSELKVELHLKDVKTKKSDEKLCMYVMTTTPKLTCLGYDENDAAAKMLDSLCIMCT